MNGRKMKPFAQGPYMIAEAGSHSRRAGTPSAVGPASPKRPDGPAEVVREHREVGDGLVDVPILREAVGLANLPPIPVAVRAVVPFDESSVDR